VGTGFAGDGCSTSRAGRARASSPSSTTTTSPRWTSRRAWSPGPPPALGAFDLVLALDDAVNYLLEPDDLDRALTSLRARLAPAGLLAFDVNLLHTYRTFFATSSVVADDDLVLVWEGRTPVDARPGLLAAATLHAFAREGGGGGWRRDLSEHLQRHWPLPVVTAALARAGLRPLALYGQHLDARFAAEPDELSHTKALVVACRDDAPRTGERR
jgi:hypothetical protein